MFNSSPNGSAFNGHVQSRSSQQQQQQPPPQPLQQNPQAANPMSLQHLVSPTSRAYGFIYPTASNASFIYPASYRHLDQAQLRQLESIEIRREMDFKKRPSMLSDFHLAFTSQSLQTLPTDTSCGPEHGKRSRVDENTAISRPTQADPKKLQMPAYTPKVEAISPTPDDQPAVSSANRDHILQRIAEIDHEIAKTESNVKKMLKKKQDLEEAATTRSDGPDDVERRPLVASDENLVEKIYAETRKRVTQAHDKVAFITLPLITLPLYQQPSDCPALHEVQERHNVFRPKLISYLRKLKRIKEVRERVLSEKYNQQICAWRKKIERLERYPKRAAKEQKSREIFERVFPELKKQREERERSSRACMLGPRNMDPTVYFATSGEAEEDERIKMRQNAVIPPLLLDQYSQKRSRFVNDNGLVRDSMSDHQFRLDLFKMVWTEEEKRIFKEKFVQYGKNFAAISFFLEKKTTRDCVQYYYLTKKSENYKQLLRRKNTRRGRPYRPPQMPRLESTRENAENIEMDTHENDSVAQKEPETCVVCKSRIEPSDHGRVLTRAVSEQYGIDIDISQSQNLRVCQKCRLPVVKKTPQCAIGTCTMARRKVRQSRSFPPKWAELSENERRAICEEFQFNMELSRCCALCYKRLHVRVEGALLRDGELNEEELAVARSENWTDHELNILQEAVANLSTANWTTVAEKLEKTAAQCRRQYLLQKQVSSESRMKVAPPKLSQVPGIEEEEEEDETANSEEDDSNNAAADENMENKTLSPKFDGKENTAPPVLAASGRSNNTPLSSLANEPDKRRDLCLQENLDRKLSQSQESVKSGGDDSCATLSADEGHSESESASRHASTASRDDLLGSQIKTSTAPATLANESSRLAMVRQETVSAGQPYKPKSAHIHRVEEEQRVKSMAQTVNIQTPAKTHNSALAAVLAEETTKVSGRRNAESPEVIEIIRQPTTKVATPTASLPQASLARQMMPIGVSDGRARGSLTQGTPVVSQQLRPTTMAATFAMPQKVPAVSPLCQMNPSTPVPPGARAGVSNSIDNLLRANTPQASVRVDETTGASSAEMARASRPASLDPPRMVPSANPMDQQHLYQALMHNQNFMNEQYMRAKQLNEQQALAFYSAALSGRSDAIAFASAAAALAAAQQNPSFHSHMQSAGMSMQNPYKPDANASMYSFGLSGFDQATQAALLHQRMYDQRRMEQHRMLEHRRMMAVVEQQQMMAAAAAAAAAAGEQQKLEQQQRMAAEQEQRRLEMERTECERQRQEQLQAEQRMQQQEYRRQLLEQQLRIVEAQRAINQPATMRMPVPYHPIGEQIMKVITPTASPVSQQPTSRRVKQEPVNTPSPTMTHLGMSVPKPEDYAQRAAQQKSVIQRGSSKPVQEMVNPARVMSSSKEASLSIKSEKPLGLPTVSSDTLMQSGHSAAILTKGAMKALPPTVAQSASVARTVRPVPQPGTSAGFPMPPTVRSTPTNLAASGGRPIPHRDALVSGGCVASVPSSSNPEGRVAFLPTASSNSMLQPMSGPSVRSDESVTAASLIDSIISQQFYAKSEEAANNSEHPHPAARPLFDSSLKSTSKLPKEPLAKTVFPSSGCVETPRITGATVIQPSALPMQQSNSAGSDKSSLFEHINSIIADDYSNSRSRFHETSGSRIPPVVPEIVVPPSTIESRKEENLSKSLPIDNKPIAPPIQAPLDEKTPSLKHVTARLEPSIPQNVSMALPMPALAVVDKHEIAQPGIPSATTEQKQSETSVHPKPAGDNSALSKKEKAPSSPAVLPTAVATRSTEGANLLAPPSTFEYELEPVSPPDQTTAEKETIASTPTTTLPAAASMLMPAVTPALASANSPSQSMLWGRGTAAAAVSPALEVDASNLKGGSPAAPFMAWNVFTLPETSAVPAANSPSLNIERHARKDNSRWPVSYSHQNVSSEDTESSRAVAALLETEMRPVMDAGNRGVEQPTGSQNVLPTYEPLSDDES